MTLSPSPVEEIHRRPTSRQAPRGAAWQQRYARYVAATDAAVLCWAVFGAAFVCFGFTPTNVSAPAWIPFDVSYLVVSAVLVVTWMLFLSLVGSRSYRVIGTGAAEYKAVAQSAGYLLLVLALAAFASQVQFSRPYLLVALPAGVLGLLVSRFLWRSWLALQRRFGRFSARVLVVGSVASVGEIAVELRNNPSAGYHVVGAVVSTGEAGTHVPGTDIPVVGHVRDVLEAVDRVSADTVLVVGGHGLSSREMRRLSWSLEPSRKQLVVAPSITEIAGPRIHPRPVAGLPLIHVEMPRYEGADRYVKRGFDILVSCAALVVLSVPLLLVAVAVAVTSPGGVFFSHERIGKDGVPFRMLKFRSMVADADARLPELLASQGTGDTPLFKVKDDPRITRIGGFMRRFSIDEIPQLINVVRGEMSLVGPRPQVAHEVALYDRYAARRLYVQPGMTGLWQVSGRSNLSWEESVRLDLFYVENWSLSTDVAILSRTLRAVLASEGAV